MLTILSGFRRRTQTCFKIKESTGLNYLKYKKKNWDGKYSILLFLDSFIISLLIKTIRHFIIVASRRVGGNTFPPI